MKIKLEQEKAKTTELEKQNQQNGNALEIVRQLQAKVRRMEKYHKKEG